MGGTTVKNVIVVIGAVTLVKPSRGELVQAKGQEKGDRLPFPFE
jgi:hypothetical protein